MSFMYYTVNVILSWKLANQRSIREQFKKYFLWQSHYTLIKIRFRCNSLWDSKWEWYSYYTVGFIIMVYPDRQAAGEILVLWLRHGCQDIVFGTSIYILLSDCIIMYSLKIQYHFNSIQVILGTCSHV